jgi:signal recognition particle GTPase
MSLLKSGRPSENKNKALKLLEKDIIVKININITKNFHKEVKRYALEKDITITELIHNSLQEYMKNNN